MILSRKHFNYHNNVLIEKVVVQLPFRYEAIFQNEGCFLFIKGVKSTIYSSSDSLKLQNREAVLLKCGPYFVDWIKDSRSEEVEVIAIHLYPEILRELYRNELPELLSKSSTAKQIKPVLAHVVLDKFIESLEFYFEHPELVNNDLLELKIRELILLLIQTNDSQSIHQILSDMIAPSSASIREVVQTHLFSNLSVNDMAVLAGLSLSTFKREFKKIYDAPPNKFVIDQRIEKASKLLRSTNLDISEIAFEVGFNDPSYFTRVFKSKTGHSPREFKRNSA